MVTTQSQSEPADATAAALQRHTLQAVSQVRDAIGNGPELILLESGVRDFFQAMAGVQEKLSALQGDRDLSEEGKARRREQLTEQLDELKRKTFAEVTEAVGKYRARHEGDFAPVPPESDPMLLEAKLQGARMDARMMFDGVQANLLPLAMHQAIESGKNPFVAYLLLATPWGDAYLQAKQASPATMGEWGQRKLHAWPHLLSANQRQGYKALAQLEKVEQTLAGAYQLFVSDRGLRAGEAGSGYHRR